MLESASCNATMLASKPYTDLHWTVQLSLIRCRIQFQLRTLLQQSTLRHKHCILICCKQKYLRTTVLVICCSYAPAIYILDKLCCASSHCPHLIPHNTIHIYCLRLNCVNLDKTLQLASIPCFPFIHCCLDCFS